MSVKDIRPGPEADVVDLDDHQQQFVSSASPHISNRTTTSEPTDSALRQEYNRLENLHREGITRDKSDVDNGLNRERRFTVDWNRMSRNKLWAENEDPEECAYFDGTPEEYIGHVDIWPYGRHLHEINLHRQLYDFFRFMWGHTKPYKTVAVILLMSITKPLQLAVLSWVAQYIQEHPRTAPLWIYFFTFYGFAIERILYWWYEMWVPLNSQRVQLRCVLLKKRTRLSFDHPVAVKWPAGRFTGLLKDVDDVINNIWLSMLSMFDDAVSMFYILILCFVNLKIAWEEDYDDTGSQHPYIVYVGIFLALGIVTMASPFVWFWMFVNKIDECETMIRDGQALYMSASNDRLLSASAGVSCHSMHGQSMEGASGDTAVKAYWLYGRTTFRGFFHRLAWTTNYSMILHFVAPFVTYFLLTEGGFGVTYSPANILIILLSLKELTSLSTKLLDYMVKMSRGCNVLRDVAELLNAKVDDNPLLDLESGTGHMVQSESSEEKEPLNSLVNENVSILDQVQGDATMTMSTSCGEITATSSVGDHSSTIYPGNT